MGSYAETFDHPRDWIGRCGGRLEHAEDAVFIGDHQVGEGSTCINSKAKSHWMFQSLQGSPAVIKYDVLRVT